MRSVKVLIAAGAASLLSQAAFGADLAIAPSPYYAPPPIQDFGGWYLRGDVGMTNSSATLFNNNYATVPAGGLQQLGEGFTGGTSWGLGVGYQFNNWFRADITGEYRSRVGFTGTDIATFPGAVFSDVYQGGYTSWVGLVNVYADLGTWWCITPFVGAGVGAANIQTSGLQDSGSNLTGGVLSGGASYFANGGACRSCLSREPQLHRRTRLPLSRHGHRQSRFRHFVRWQQCRPVFFPVPRHNLAGSQARRALDLLRRRATAAAADSQGLIGARIFLMIANGAGVSRAVLFVADKPATTIG
jgi:opacity protein-like surface antigen